MSDQRPDSPLRLRVGRTLGTTLYQLHPDGTEEWIGGVKCFAGEERSREVAAQIVAAVNAAAERRIEALVDWVDAVMRAESDRLAASGTAAAVEQGIGVAKAISAVRAAIMGESVPVEQDRRVMARSKEYAAEERGAAQMRERIAACLEARADEQQYAIAESAMREAAGWCRDDTIWAEGGT